MSRRRFGALTGSVMASALFGACGKAVEPQGGENGRLAATLKTSVKTTAEGEHEVGLEHGRDAVLQIPAQIPNEPLPLLVFLHGAGSSAAKVLKRLGTAPSEAGVAVLAVDSRGSTWDGIHGPLGPDVRFLGQVLSKVSEKVSIDPARLTLGGFSDGATYALSLGIINGDLFHRVIAFSPGYIVEGSAHGKPRIFISHGKSDEVLPIDQCSRRIVPDLKQRGLDVTFREFEGSHEIPPDVAAEGMAWVAARDTK